MSKSMSMRNIPHNFGAEVYGVTRSIYVDHDVQELVSHLQDVQKDSKYITRGQVAKDDKDKGKKTKII